MDNTTNHFQIDFFELMFLAESVIPPNPIARSICFDNFSEVHYHKMSKEQILQFFNHVQNCHGFSKENDQCRHFYARFNPKNQYVVKTFYEGRAEEFMCYLFDGEYRTSKNRYVNKEYIKSIMRVHDSLAVKSF